MISLIHSVWHYSLKLLAVLVTDLFGTWCLAIVWGMQGITYNLQIIYLLLGGSVGTAIYKFLKHKTTRPRPYQVHQVIVLGERPLDHFSFPSGHTLHAVMVTIVLGYINLCCLQRCCRSWCLWHCLVWYLDFTIRVMWLWAHLLVQQ